MKFGRAATSASLLWLGSRAYCVWFIRFVSEVSFPNSQLEVCYIGLGALPQATLTLLLLSLALVLYIYIYIKYKIYPPFSRKALELRSSLGMWGRR